MPTNLKSLLTRPRSRNELKLREKEDPSQGAPAGESCEPESASESERSDAPSIGKGECSGGHFGSSGVQSNFTNYDESATNSNSARPACKNFFSCSALPALELVSERDFSPSPDSNDRCCGSRREEGNTLGNNAPSIRKCKTVLALSRISTSPTFTTASTPSSPVGPGMEFPPSEEGASLSASRVRMMRDRLYSASSSTLNNLINSSSSRTTKLFSGWKFPKNSNHNNGANASAASSLSNGPKGQEENSECSSSGTPGMMSPLNGFLAGFKSRSQVSVSEGSVGGGSPFGASSPAMPVTPVNRLRKNFPMNSSSNLNFSSSNLQVCGQCSRSNSFNSFRSWREEKAEEVFCRLCLSNFTMEDTICMDACSCRYCKDCLIAYVSFEIQEGAYEISCPDANCEKEGVLTLAEIGALVPKSLLEKHSKFRLYRDIEKDGQLTWCPSPGCETVCRIQEAAEKDLSGLRRSTINCTTCSKTFCAECKLSSHPDISCEAHRRKLVKQGKVVVDESEIYSIKSIKKCPFCHVPIEKDSGCAQMMCKRCKHVFCWYCLTSLDDDFLLRHYDKGPCKNKLGHSRASVVWHRAQVIGIFAGFGVLVLLASPLLILAAPCLLCCRCGYCANKLDPKDPVQL